MHRRLLFVIILLPGFALAVCNNPHDWWRHPSANVEVYFDVNYDAVYKTGMALSKQKHGEESPSFFDPHGTPTDDSRFLFDGILRENLVDPAKYEQGRNTPYFVYFYERDDKGSRRLCRIARILNAADRDPNESARHKKSNPRFHPRLKPLLQSGKKILIPFSAYLYDPRGRISGQYALENLADKKPTHAIECYLYTPDGYLSKHVIPRRYKTCDQVDEWDDATIYHYNKVGRLLAWGYHAVEKGRYRWSEKLNLDMPLDNSPKGTGAGIMQTDSKYGVFEFSSGTCFSFPKRPPAAWTKDLLGFEQKLLTLDRVDKCAENGIPKLAFYPAGSKTPTHKLFRDEDGSVLRHEQYDKTGKLKRAINRGDPKEELNRALYKEDLKRYAIKPNALWYRVYDYDAQGRETLVAISWFPLSLSRLSAAVSEGSREKMLRQQRFGLPDGTEKWKDEASFQKAFGFLPNPWETFFGKDDTTDEQRSRQENSCDIPLNPHDLKLDGEPLDTSSCKPWPTH